MFTGKEWMEDWALAEQFSLRIGQICTAVPLRGSWEPNDRIALAMAALRMTREHHDAIHLLYRNGYHSSARALARPLLEAGLRTVWLVEKAEPSEIKAILRGKEKGMTLGTLTANLKNHGFEGVSGPHASVLDSLTHGGPRALGAQFFEEGTRQRFDAAIIAQAGFSVGAAAYSAAKSIGRHDIIATLEKEMPEVN